MKVYELEPMKHYGMFNSTLPDHVVYFLDHNGDLYTYDTLSETESVSDMAYPDILNAKFYELRLREI